MGCCESRHKGAIYKSVLDNDKTESLLDNEGLNFRDVDYLDPMGLVDNGRSDVPIGYY